MTHTSEQDLIRLHQSFSRSFDDVARSTDPRSGLEMLLVRMALRPDLLPVDELLHRLAHLERRLMGEGGGRRLAPSNDTQKRGPIERPEREVPNSAGAPRPRDARPAANKSSTGITEALEDPDPAAPPLAVQAKAPHKPPLDETRTSDAATAPIEQPVPVTQPAGPAPMARPAEKPSETAVPSETEPKGESPPHQAAAKGAVQPTRDPSPPQPFTAPPAAEIIEISERVRQVDPRAGALLDQLYPPRTLGEELVFAFDAGFIFEREVSDPKFIELVQKEAQGVLGPNVAISVRKQQGREPGTITLAEERERKRKEKLDLAIRKAQAHPVVQAAKSLLGADITQVRVPEEP